MHSSSSLSLSFVPSNDNNNTNNTNYGTISMIEEDKDKDSALIYSEIEKDLKTRTVLKSLIIGLFLIVGILLSIYYFGGFSSNSIINAGGSNHNNNNYGSSIKNKLINTGVMSHISEKYYESMMINQRVNSDDSDASGTDCDSLRAQLNEETQERTNEFVRYYSNQLNDYLYTVYSDEVDNAGASYQSDGSAGYLWSGELPGVTKPLYRYINENCNGNGNDHFYSTNLADYGASNWQQISGFIMSQSCSFNTALYEYYSESTCNHYYTINQNEASNLNGDFEFVRIVGYVAKE